MADEKIQGNNDRERLLFIAKTYGSAAKIPKSEIASRSADGATIITVQGTKVNDELLRAAVAEDQARTAAARTAAGLPEGVVTQEQVKQMIEEAVQSALASQKQPPTK